MTTTTSAASVLAREACLGALREAAGGAVPTSGLDGMLAAAWWAGTRCVRDLAAAAGLTVDEVREALRRVGADLADETFEAPHQPRYVPLHAAEVRALAGLVDHVCGSAMLRESDLLQPEALAAWHAGLVLRRLAAAMDHEDRAERAKMAEDAVAHARTVLEQVQRVQAALCGREDLAQAAGRDDLDAIDVEGQAVTEGAVVTLGLPIGHSITVTVSQQPYGRPDAGYGTIASQDLLLDTTTPLTGAEHLRLRHALDTVAQVLTGRLDATARGFED
ncbi:hypothetical protein ACPC54_30335 [Kitasatospora sp. NPDC094028]